MVIDETLIAFIISMPFLAALGLTTLCAFILMPVLGLITEWSFRRIFFTSFLLSLFAPIVAAVSLAQSVDRMMDGRDLREVITQTIPGGEERMEQWEEAGERARETVRAAERGEITEEEAERRLEQIINEQTGVQIDLEDVVIEPEEGVLRIETQ